MSKRQFRKPPLTYPQLLDRLKDRGLTIRNEAKALHLLRNISYYRLSGYWYPFLRDKRNHIFKTGATFENAFKLYCFDRELRLMVLREIEKIEVAVRSQLNHFMAHAKGVFWFMDSSIFRDQKKHEKSLEKIRTECTRSDEQFIQSFNDNYLNEYPPCWMTLEVVSFGSLSMIYENLKSGRTKRMIAEQFALDHKVFTSWLHSLVYIRNVCAHHNRLWNRVLRVQPRNPKSPHKQWLDNVPRNNRTYFILSILIYWLNTVNPNHTFVERFLNLLEEFPNVDPSAMGFTDKWRDEPLWNKG